jgi:hypothetical protein
MAPTKANATYAVTTLSLLTMVMGILPWFTSYPQITPQANKAFPAEKVSVAVHPGLSTAGRHGNMVNDL